MLTDTYTIEDAEYDLARTEPRTADDILTAPPLLEESTDSFDLTPIADIGDTLDESREALEKSMVRALMRVMNSTTAKEADIIKAVSETGDLLGKKGKGVVNIIRSENAQINQIMEKPELMDHIKKAAEGIKQVSTASDAHIKVHTGGKGS